MKFILFWWFAYRLSDIVPAAGSTTFESQTSCEVAGKAIEERLTKKSGFGFGWICVAQGDATSTPPP